MNADGTSMQNLTNSAAAEGWPAWYPDGSRILYSSDPTGTFCLYSMKPDGTDVRQISHASGPWRDARGSVSPDGKWIVFNRQQDDATIAIVIMPLPRR
jgi:TolB protein